MWRGNDAERPDPIREPLRHHPSKEATPVVPDEVKALYLHRVRQCDHVTDEVLGAVMARFRRPRPAAVATLIGRDRSVARVPQGPELVAPGPRGLREAMQAQDPPAIVGPTGTPGEREVAGLDFDPVDGPGHVAGRHRCAALCGD